MGTFFGIAFGDKIHWVHFGEVHFGLKVRWVRFSGSLFWSGFVGYVFGDSILRQGLGGCVRRECV